MPKIRYEDFEVEITSIGARSYEARVLNSPAGRGKSKFKPPFRAVELDSILSALEAGVCGSARAARDLEREQATCEAMTPLDVQELGRQLFQRLFQGVYWFPVKKTAGWDDNGSIRFC